MQRILQAIREAVAIFASVARACVATALFIFQPFAAAMTPGYKDRAEAASVERQAAEQAAAEQQQARQQQRQRDVEQLVKLFMMAARWRSAGRDITPLAAELPDNLSRYVRSLNTEECHLVSELDARTVGEYLSGARSKIPGVRSPAEALGTAFGDAPAAARKPTAPGEDAILDKLAERLKARGRTRSPAASERDYAAA